MGLATPDQCSPQYLPLAASDGARVAPGALDNGDGTGTQRMTTGGGNPTPIAAAKTANTVIKNTAGRVASVVVNATGTNAMTISDGTLGVLCTVPANAAVGSICPFQMPFPNSITVNGNVANPGVTVVWD